MIYIIASINFCLSLPRLMRIPSLRLAKISGDWILRRKGTPRKKPKGLHDLPSPSICRTETSCNSWFIIYDERSCLLTCWTFVPISPLALDERIPQEVFAKHGEQVRETSVPGSWPEEDILRFSNSRVPWHFFNTWFLSSMSVDPTISQDPLSQIEVPDWCQARLHIRSLQVPPDLGAGHLGSRQALRFV